MADYGQTDISTTPLGTNQFPVSAVFVPGDTKLTTLEGRVKSTDGNGRTSSPARVEVKDGSDVAQGLTTDAAVTGDNAGTLSAKLRGLTKIFTDIWDSVNHRIKVDGSGVTQPVSGVVAVSNFPGTQPVSGTFWQVTQPVSLSSLPSLVAGSALIGSVELVDSAGTNKLAIDASGRLTLIPNSSINSAQVAGTAVSVNAGNRDAGTQRIIESGNPTPTVTQVISAASDTSLLAANANRKGTLFFNDSTATLYLLYGTGVASTTNYSVQIQPKGYFEDPFHYTGGFHGIWSAANGFVYCTEVS